MNVDMDMLAAGLEPRISQSFSKTNILAFQHGKGKSEIQFWQESQECDRRMHMFSFAHALSTIVFAMIVA
jgi:hypothetical protein